MELDGVTEERLKDYRAYLDEEVLPVDEEVAYGVMSVLGSLPEDFICAAMDENGSWWAFRTVPVCGKKRWNPLTRGGGAYLITERVKRFIGWELYREAEDWKRSIIYR